MATAKRTKTTITKEVPAYQLTLTEGEMDFLSAVLARVGGSPGQSPRKYAITIRQALESAGVVGYRLTDASPLAGGNIIFRNYPESTERRYA